MVYLLDRFFKQLNQHFLKLSLFGITLAVIVHLLISWVLLWVIGEADLVKPELYIYYYLTTATTIGYGDYSPVTTWGRVVVAFWVMPGAVALFAAYLGKTTHVVVSWWRRGMQGKGNYSSLTDHFLILGWHGDGTTRMVELITADAKRAERDIVLCVDDEIENPLPDVVSFVQGRALSDESLLLRAGVKNASRIIIYGKTDDQTLSTALAVDALKPKGHIVAHFEDERKGELLNSHCSKIECNTDVAIEMLVRSAEDPGSSRVQTQLLSALAGPTQFSLKIPDNFEGTDFGKLFYYLKEHHNATAFGIAGNVAGTDLVLNPKKNSPIKSGQLVYFMAQERITSDEVRWGSLVG
ncbi:potassium channel family protein [Spartinivicinus marinus]|uniref:potassium channel family protein n=1 Tax=Spartinivicinus marinus TaxID=2994442 RepID=UPI001C5C988C|nr:potassium channel family protein [Spartinivicinus marinus]